MDLVLTAMYYDSFGWHTREEYEDFARVYGYDISPGFSRGSVAERRA